jgi:hypothetical protein
VAKWARIAFVACAHIGRFGEKSRSGCSQVRFMACSLLLTSSRLRPPSLLGRNSVSIFTGGEWWSGHMNFVTRRWRVQQTVWGAPWTLARYCMLPPTTMSTTNFFPLRDNFRLFQRSSKVDIRSIKGSQMAWLSTQFPIHPPRRRMGEPSSTMWTWFGMGEEVGFVFLCSRT